MFHPTDTTTANPRLRPTLEAGDDTASALRHPSGNQRRMLPSADNKSTSRVVSSGAGEEKLEDKPIDTRAIRSVQVDALVSDAAPGDESSALNKTIERIKKHSLELTLKSDLPENLQNVQSRLISARDSLMVISEAAPLDVRQKSLNTFTRANHDYLMAFSSAIHSAKQADGKAVNPSMLNSLANVVLGVANNLAFTLPVALSTLAPEGLPRAAIAGGMTALGVDIGERFTKITKAQLGIASPSLGLATNSHSINGPFKSIQSKALDQTLGTIVYAVARALLLQINKADGAPSAGSIIYIGLGAALLMNLLKEVTYNTIANQTLAKTGAKDVSELPIMEGSRAQNIAVVYHQQPDNLGTGWTKLDTAKLKASVSMDIIGALGLAGTSFLTSGIGRGVGGEVAKIGAQFAAFFYLKDLVETVSLKVALDPRANPLVNISGMQNLQHFLRESSMESIVSGINHLTDYLNSDADSPDADGMRQQFVQVRNALSLGPLYNPTAAEEYKQGAKALSHAVNALADQSVDNPMIEKAHRHLANALAYLEDIVDDSPRNTTRNVSTNDNLAFLEPAETTENARAHIRLAQAALLHGNVAHGSHTAVERIASAVLPVFAALRDYDLNETAKAFVMDLGAYKPTGDGARDAVAERFSARLSAQGTNEVSTHVLAKLINQMPNTREHALQQLQAVGDGTADNSTKAKVLVVQNIVKGMSSEPSANNPRIDVNSIGENVVAALSSVENREALDQLVEKMTLALSLNEVSAESVAEQLAPLVNDQGILDDIEEKNPRLGAMMKALDKAFPGSPTNKLIVASKEAVRTLALDNVEIHKKHVELFNASVSYSPAFGKGLYGNSEDAVNMNTPQKDVHFHPTDYDSRRNSDLILSYLMGENAVEHTLYEGIPHTMKGKTYYDKLIPQSIGDQLRSVITGDNSGANLLRYDTSQDHKLAESLRRTTEKVPDITTKVSMSITGFDINDGKHMTDHMDEMMRTYPELVKSVGEVTLYKEVVSKASAQVPVIDSQATRTLLDATAERGLPLVLHCDVSTPGSKGKFRSELVKVLKEAAGEMNSIEGKISPSDKLAMKASSGGIEVPPKRLSVVWAHGGGISRYTRAANDHTEQLNKLFDDPALKESLSLDLSWDYVAKNILLNTSDLFIKEEFPQSIVQGLKAVMQSYDSFIAQGGRADEANDGLNKNLAAVHKISTDNLAQLHLEILSDFKSMVKLELDGNPELLKKFTTLMTDHGSKGNNWLNVLASNSERIMYGSDSLTPGSKYHGEMAYALNTKMLYPIYDMFSAVGDELQKAESQGVDAAPISSEKCHKIVADVARDTFDRVIESKDMKDRRESFLFDLSQSANKPTANVAPISRNIDSIV